MFVRHYGTSIGSSIDPSTLRMLEQPAPIPELHRQPQLNGGEAQEHTAGDLLCSPDRHISPLIRTFVNALRKIDGPRRRCRRSVTCTIPTRPPGGPLAASSGADRRGGYSHRSVSAASVAGPGVPETRTRGEPHRAALVRALENMTRVTRCDASLAARCDLKSSPPRCTGCGIFHRSEPGRP